MNNQFKLILFFIGFIMSENWIVQWNYKLYDYKKLIRDYKNNNHSGIIYQPKKCSMCFIIFE